MVAEQPDGRWSYVVLVAAVVVRIVVNGLWASPGVLLVATMDKFGGTSADASWISSLLNGFSFMACPISGLLVQRFGTRLVALAGGLVTFLGLSTSFFARSILHLYFTYGITTGVGIGIAYIASTEALKAYFVKNRNLSLGFGAGLSGLGTVIFPPLIQFLIQDIGLNQMFLVMAALSAHVVPCALLFRPICPAQDAQSPQTKRRGSGACRTWTFLCVWDFYILTTNCLAYVLGSGMVLAHLSAYTVRRGVGTEQDASILYSVIGAMLMVSKIGQGWLANLGCVKERVRWLYMACCLTGGLCTLLLLLALPLAALYVYSVIFGFAHAAFGGALIPALIISITGDTHFAFAYGIIMCFCAVGQFLGPPIAGWILDATGSYHLPFALASFCMIVSAAVMLVRCQRQADKIKAAMENDVIVVEAGDVKEKLMESKPETLDSQLVQHVSSV